MALSFNDQATESSILLQTTGLIIERALAFRYPDPFPESVALRLPARPLPPAFKAFTFQRYGVDTHVDDNLAPFSVSRQNAWLVLKIFTIVLRLVIRRFYLSVSPPHRHPRFAGECFVRNLIQCHDITGNGDTSSAIDTAFGTACGFATGR